MADNVKPSPYLLKKELTLKLTRKIGSLLFELEMERADEKAKLTVRDEDGKCLIIDEELEITDLEKLMRFFDNAMNEVERLKSVEPPI